MRIHQWNLFNYYLHADSETMGSSAGSGEIIELAEHIYAAGQDFHGLSLGLGLGTLLIIRICKKWIPKFPIAILIMAAGVVSTVYFHVDAKGCGHRLILLEPDFRHFHS